MTDERHDPEPDDRRMHRVYVLVLAVEAVVISALWTFSHYFSR